MKRGRASWYRMPVRKKKSRILWRTGRVILEGKDYTEFRRTLFQRSGGHCEIPKEDGEPCGVYAPWMGYRHGEVHHVIKRSHGGSDTPENCFWSCDSCHRGEHPGPQWSGQENVA
jgi:5-methylcytosine-specific restriction endonuclease McrA